MNQGLLYREGSLDDVEDLIQLGLWSYGTYKKVLTPANWETLN
jgi:hypothetical protein